MRAMVQYVYVYSYMSRCEIPRDTAFRGTAVPGSPPVFEELKERFRTAGFFPPCLQLDTSDASSTEILGTLLLQEDGSKDTISMQNSDQGKAPSKHTGWEVQLPHQMGQLF